jgi:hypothetical protein
MQFQKSDPIFNMGVNIMRPSFNFEPKYRDAMLTREEWIRGPGTSSTVRQLVWYTDGSRTLGGAAAGDYGQSLGRSSVSVYKNMPQSSRLRYMLSWPLLMKFK